MDNAFNPYQEWLGIDPAKHAPTYFDLFKLGENVSDESTINSAAETAMSRVRACRPGSNARQWASLLDELDRAKATLMDSEKRSVYLQQLQSGQRPNHASPNSNEGQGNIQHNNPVQGGPAQQQQDPVQQNAAAQTPVTRPVPYSSQQKQEEVATPIPTYSQVPQQVSPQQVSPQQVSPQHVSPHTAEIPSGYLQTPSPLAQAPVPQAPVPQAPVPQAPVSQAPVPQAPVPQAPAYGGLPPAALYAPQSYPAADPMAPAALFPAPSHQAASQPAPGHQAPGHQAAGHQAAGHQAPGHQAAGPQSYPPNDQAPAGHQPIAPAGPPPNYPPAPAAIDPMAPMAPAPGYNTGSPTNSPMLGGPIPTGPMQASVDPVPTAMLGAPMAAMPGTMTPGAPTAIPTPGGPAVASPHSLAMNPMAPAASFAMGTVVGGATPGGPPLATTNSPDPMSPAAAPKPSIAVSSDSSAKSAARRNNSALNQVVLLGSIAVGVLLLAIFIFFGLHGGGDPNEQEVAQNTPDSAPDTPNRIKKATDNRRPKQPRKPQNRPVPNVAPVNIEPTGPSNPTPIPAIPVPNTPDPNTPVPNTPVPNTPVPNTPVPNTPDPNTPDPNTPDPNAPDPNTPDPNTPDPNAPDPNAPDPNTPDPNAQPKPEELQQLNDELNKARMALHESDFATTYQHLDKSDTLAKTEPQMDTVDRLRLLTDYAKGYQEGIIEAIDGFEAGSTIKLRGVAEVVIVEVLPTKLIIRASGRNKTFDRAKLPVVLSLAIADSWFDNTGGSKACQAAFLLLHPTASDDDKALGEKLLVEAAKSGIEATDLRLAIEELGKPESQ